MFPVLCMCVFETMEKGVQVAAGDVDPSGRSIDVTHLAFRCATFNHDAAKCGQAKVVYEKNKNMPCRFKDGQCRTSSWLKISSKGAVLAPQARPPAPLAQPPAGPSPTELNNAVNHVCKVHWAPGDTTFLDRRIRGVHRFVGDELFVGPILQFGVLGGGSLRAIRRALPFSSAVWAFDSFHGLPPEAHGELSLIGFQEGTWSLTGNETLTQQRLKSLKEQVHIVVGEDVRLIDGFYNVSLTDELAADISANGSVAYVDIDVDLYQSAYEALDWLFFHKLLAPGTVIGYDDYWGHACMHPAATSPENFGEAKAHAQISRKYGARFECICGACDDSFLTPSNWTSNGKNITSLRTFFILRDFSRSSSGFEMNKSTLGSWFEHGSCAKAHRYNRSRHFFLSL